MKNKTYIHRSLIEGFSVACINLKIIAGSEIDETTLKKNTSEWYPIDEWIKFQDRLINKYKDYQPIMTRVGMEMMMGWYHHGPGKTLINNGVDFITHQTGSLGYHSVIKGDPAEIGTFDLIELDTKNKKAIVHSTTPFNREMEKGVLLGGMKAPDDLVYIDINNDDDTNIFKIQYY